jgi:hypothetical protein
MRIEMGGRWRVPAAGIVLGALMFGAAVIGGRPVLGVAMLGVMAVYTTLLVAFRGRSTTVGVLAGTPADERFASFNVTATAIAGTVAIVVSIGGFLVAVAQGRSGDEFAIVAASAGVAYLVALGWLQVRS